MKILLLVDDINHYSIKSLIQPLLSGFQVDVQELYKEPDRKKTRASVIKQIIEEYLLNDVSRYSYTICCNSDYFKRLTNSNKSEATLGQVFDIGISKVLYAPTVASFFYDKDKTLNSFTIAVEALKAHVAGNYVNPGEVLRSRVTILRSINEFEDLLNQIQGDKTTFTYDLETYSLKHYNAGIGSIALGLSESEAYSFYVGSVAESNKDTYLRVKKALRNLFSSKRNKSIAHNISFDGYVLIYELYMKHILDQRGLLIGLNNIFNNWDCTQLITYLATNSCSGNDLSLKTQAQEFAGNYALDGIKDIQTIHQDDLCIYNGIDTLSTWYVYNKNYPKMVQDDQKGIYNRIFKPATLDVVQMQLTGLPVDIEQVRQMERTIYSDIQDAESIIYSHPAIINTSHRLASEWAEGRNRILKKKRVSYLDWPFKFNLNSDDHIRALLFDEMGLEPKGTTETGLPSVDKNTISYLINTSTDPNQKNLLQNIQQHSLASKIATTYLPTFLNAVEGVDGWNYIFGSFKLGGTVSGRLSSSNPNLQNMPSGSKYGNLIKQCVSAPPGWVFCGADFSSLEDRISALTTKDKNKLKIYTDHYDGHSLRAFSYFGNEMTNIDPNDVNSINKIKDRYPYLREKSKIPTFALTYGGSYMAIHEQTGIPIDEAKEIEKNYHILYEDSDKWVEDKINQARINGYVTVAFGLRVRTPILAQTINASKGTPYEARSEARTAGNALGQSYGLLNTRAATEFLEGVRSSPYKLDIKPCVQIHDAQYYLVRDNIDVVEYTNTNLIKCMGWQDDPAIYHEEVKLEAELDIFHPSWAEPITIPNNISGSEIRQIVTRKLHDRHRT